MITGYFQNSLSLSLYHFLCTNMENRIYIILSWYLKLLCIYEHAIELIFDISAIFHVYIGNVIESGKYLNKKENNAANIIRRRSLIFRRIWFISHECKLKWAHDETFDAQFQLDETRNCVEKQRRPLNRVTRDSVICDFAFFLLTRTLRHEWCTCDCRGSVSIYFLFTR